MNPYLVGSRIPEYVKPELSEDDKAKLLGLHGAYDFYKVFSPDSWMNEVVNQSRLYAVQKGHNKHLPMLTKRQNQVSEEIAKYVNLCFNFLCLHFRKKLQY